MILGQDRAVGQFAEAWSGRKLHHAWLLAGPKGVGKASFAHAAARRVLADAAGPRVDLPGIATPDDHPMVKLIEADSHPDLRWLTRLPKEKGEGLARDITIKQVRALGEFMGMTPAMSPWRVAVIDSVDELQAAGANALLKILEEPPANTIFFLVTNAAGRLLPTIRSRCRRLDLLPLDGEAMTSILEKHAPDLSAQERQRVVAMAAGSASRALAFAELGLAKLEEMALGILLDGDPTNARRSQLAVELARKGASDRYAAFLDLVPAMIARETRRMTGTGRERGLDAYARARELAGVAPRLSLDPAATVFQLGGILAEAAPPPSARR